MSFDVLADDRIADQESDWLFQVSMARRRARSHDALTDLRSAFIREHALKDPNPMGQGAAKKLDFQKRLMPSAVFFTAKRKADEVLTVFPRYSARLLLSIRLLTPMLTKDDDPFYLFDNPVRKDHILGLPYLSAAAIKGLAADAYQRAFPGNVNWQVVGQQAGVHQFRCDDHNQNDLPQSALRLFGIADDGANDPPSQIGRLHFSPLWFDTVQFLVMNPGNPERAIGTLPIQFEAVAPDKPNQAHEIEVIYCNPYDAKDTDETHVRADLARFLAALAMWWPALGLGAKRLAGYGAIEISKAELQAVGWTGLGDQQSPSAAKPAASTVPEFVTRFMTDVQLIDRETLQAQSKAQREAWKLQPDVQALEQEKENLKSITNKNRRQKERDRIKRQLDELRQPLDNSIRAQEADYARAVASLRDHPEWAGQSGSTPSQPVAELAPVIGVRTETGPDSWLKLARWIAGETV